MKAPAPPATGGVSYYTTLPACGSVAAYFWVPSKTVRSKLRRKGDVLGGQPGISLRERGSSGEFCHSWLAVRNLASPWGLNLRLASALTLSYSHPVTVHYVFPLPSEDLTEWGPGTQL